ncbi:hypothetical protein BGZ60DRAFT_417445 [Tricladium varicosporioides]|nr:hypothetical protein BGZ60DRAFT_417445 [Hymenoscyphus varicosporioides]
MYGRRDRGPKQGGLVRSGIRSLAGGVGLVSESLKERKEGKEKAKSESDNERTTPTNSRTTSEQGQSSRDVKHPEGPPPSYSAGESSSSAAAGHGGYPNEKAGHRSEKHQEGEEDNLEDEWDLDDAQDDIIRSGPEIDPTAPGAIEDEFLRHHPPPQYTPHAPAGRLSLPVVLPQRRPKDRSRGFIRAYAPMLEEVGIDQATWLEFLDAFQRQSAASPWIQAVNFAQFATLAIPVPGVGIAVGYAIGQAVKVATEIQARERTAGFLQKINENFFKPRGLFCLVMTWNPANPHRTEQVDINATIASRANPNGGVLGAAAKLRSSDGKTYGEWQFPEVAPLIFPGLDEIAAQSGGDEAKKQSKMADRMGYVAKYWDKRATAAYAGQNPDSVLAQVPQEGFKSRYADPNHAASRGSLISFVTGGKLVPNPESRGLIGGIINVTAQAVRGEKQGSGWDRVNKNPAMQDPYYDPRYNRYGRGYRGRGRRENKVGIISTPVGAYKKLVKQNVLYLMVVNLPTAEEIAGPQGQPLGGS